jgi:hypothetical protein
MYGDLVSVSLAEQAIEKILINKKTIK